MEKISENLVAIALTISLFMAFLCHMINTVKKNFRITDEFAHNYVIFVTILCPTLTKMDTLIIQNKLRILRNGFQNSRNPFPILVDFQKSGKDYRYSVINYRYSIIFSDPSFYKF